ncbi:hypothetical protein [Cohnella sp.]
MEKENQESLKNQKKSESENKAQIKPGYDYIWGSDQDDLAIDKDDLE